MKRTLLRFALLCVLGGHAAASEPFLEKLDLFAAKVGGFARYRIPGIVVTAKGTALAYCEARKNSGEDWGEIEVHLRRSIDGGRTWDAARQIAHLAERIEGIPKPGGEHDQSVNNPVAIVDRQGGAVHFLYCIGFARCFHICSDDDGVTFSSPSKSPRPSRRFGHAVRGNISPPDRDTAFSSRTAGSSCRCGWPMDKRAPWRRR